MMVAVPLGLAIGLVIGVVGGGGAILAVPVLVYALGQSVSAAATASLVVVALAAAAGATTLARRGLVCWRIAAGVAGAAVVGAPLGALANRAVDDALLLLLFVPVMLAAARAMWRRGRATPPRGAPACPAARIAQLAVVGAGVGALTGFFGVGGGFVLVPALTAWLGVGVHRAVASSLVIVTVTALAALAGHLAAGPTVDVVVTASLAGAAVAGAGVGAALGGRLSPAALGRGFALVVTAVALALLIDVALVGGPPTA